jgi:hypothetical protein
MKLNHASGPSAEKAAGPKLAVQRILLHSHRFWAPELHRRTAKTPALFGAKEENNLDRPALHTIAKHYFRKEGLSKAGTAIKESQDHKAERCV